MVSGQASMRRISLKRKMKSVSVSDEYYVRLSAKAEDLTCPRSTILEFLLDNYLDNLDNADVWGH